MVDTAALAEDLRELAGAWAAEIGIVERACDGVHFLLDVAGGERGVVGQCNTGDFQVSPSRSAAMLHRVGLLRVKGCRPFKCQRF